MAEAGRVGRSAGESLRAGLALARAMPLYWLVVFPCARAELRRWQRRAAAIPNRILREHALSKLDSEAMIAEGAAAFAILASRAHRRDVIRCCIAYEVMYDLLDALGESPAADPLTNNRRLHRALPAALTPLLPHEDYYAEHTERDDGGYLAALVETCQRALAQLPAYATTAVALQRFAARAAEAQSLNHAGIEQRIVADRNRRGDAHWWELAAAASDPLGVYALVAASSHRRTRTNDVEQLERAYFPWIGALTWLMESLVDAPDDATTGNHSYVGHYGSRCYAAERLGTIAVRAADAAWELPMAARHVTLLMGVTSLYLSHPGSEDVVAAEAAAAVRAAFGPAIVPLLLVLRLRRAAGR